jgi:hypothetical protein
MDAPSNMENLSLSNCITLQTIFSREISPQLSVDVRNSHLIINIEAQLAMKVMFLQGLKNVLKGSLSNMILGDVGGFSY